jgi:hypothetical protein
MKTLNLTRTDFPVVNSLDNLVVGQIYTTTNYKMLKHLKYNRGRNDGFVRARVTKIAKMVANNTFYFNVCHVLLNLKGLVIDGNNRLKMLSELGLPVNFEITAQPQFNMDDESEILNNVSDYNAINSSWGAKDAFSSALAFGERTALVIDALKTKIENEHGLETTMFTPSRLIALATRYSAGLGGVAQVRRAYCNDETANILESKDFQTELDYVIKMLKFVKQNNNQIREWFVIRNIMPTVWKKELSMKVVYANMKKKGFKNMSNVDMKGVGYRTVEILKMGNV